MPVTYYTAVVAVLQIFAMGTLGFYLVRGGVVQETGLRLLSFLAVNIFFPLFIFYQIIENFDAKLMPFWWQFPLVNISLVMTGLVIGGLLLFRHQGHLRDGFIAVSSLHNAGYIPLLMVMSLPMGRWSGQAHASVILSIIGFDSCLWSIGVWLMTRSKLSRMNFKNMINPPLLSMSAALLIVLAFGGGIIPHAILKPVKILGDAALSVAMIVIGGNLALTSLARLNWTQLLGAALIKLIVLPLTALAVLSVLKLNPLVGFVAMVQSCMPSSVTLSIIGRNYETKNQDFVNQAIFITHLLSIITIPIFLGLYGRLM